MIDSSNNDMATAAEYIHRLEEQLAEFWNLQKRAVMVLEAGEKKLKSNSNAMSDAYIEAITCVEVAKYILTGKTNVVNEEVKRTIENR